MKRASKPLVLSRLSLPFSSKLLSSTKVLTPIKPFPLARHLSTKGPSKPEKEQSFSPKSKRDAFILDKFRQRHLKGSLKSNSDSKTKQEQASTPPKYTSTGESEQVGFENDKSGATKVVSSFQQLGLKAEIIGALSEMGIVVPSEIQCVGIPALLDGKSVVFSSDSGSGRTLACLLPLIQLLRQDEALLSVKSNHPRAIVLCPSEELCDQGFQVATFISHHAKLKSAMESGSDESRTSENLPNDSIGMLVATPSETVRYIEEGSVVTDDIKFLVLDEMDSIFDNGFGSEIHRILSTIRNCASKDKDFGLQTVLVTSTVTKMLGKESSPLMEHLEQKNAGKVAAMLLEMDQKEVFDLTESLDALKLKIAEAMDSLRSP